MKPINPARPVHSARPIKPLKQVKSEEGPVPAASLMEERRRSHRVMVRMPVVLHIPERAKEIQAMTVAVSETGAMLVLREQLPSGTKLVVENPATQKRAGATVTRAPHSTAEGSLMPVEFAEPAPGFWNIFFPPPGS